MGFWKRKKQKNFEQQLEEVTAEEFSGGEEKVTDNLEQNIVGRLEQMIELTKEIEESKSEYHIVTAYLNDIQMIAELPEEEHKQLEEIAVNVVQLNAARTEFLNSAKKLSDAQFNQIERMEEEIPAAIKRFSANEIYRDTLRKDMKYLEREKSEWVLRKEYLKNQISHLRYLLYIMVGVAVTAVRPSASCSLSWRWMCSTGGWAGFLRRRWSSAPFT